jgi:hypothetical protein
LSQSWTKERGLFTPVFTPERHLDYIEVTRARLCRVRLPQGVYAR